MRVALACSALFVLGLGATGCAAKQAAVDAPAPSDLSGWEQELARAQQQLNAALPAREKHQLVTQDKATDQKVEADLDGAGAEAPAPEPAEAPARASAPGSSAAERRSPCETACKALASMQRSADRICELTDESSARCTNARSSVSDARERVERAGCGCD